MTLARCFIVVFIGLFAVVGTSNLQAQDEVIEKRIKLMKSNSAASKAIKSAVSNNDYATVASKARQIAAGLEMNQLAQHFPQGTTSSKSRAKREIWTNWDDFMTDAYKSQQSALALAKAADAKDGDKVAAAYKKLGSACNSCHKPFRAPKKKK